MQSYWVFFTSVASQKLRELTLNKLLNKNPYLYRSDGIQRPGHLLDGLLIARISSSDETIFGNEFFEPLALWVAGEAQLPGRRRWPRQTISLNAILIPCRRNRSTFLNHLIPIGLRSTSSNPCYQNAPRHQNDALLQPRQHPLPFGLATQP